MSSKRSLDAPPIVPVLPFLFWGEGSGPKIDDQKKVGTLILTSLLEDLGCEGTCQMFQSPSLRFSGVSSNMPLEIGRLTQQ